MAFRFTWTCRPHEGKLDVYAPGVDKIEYDNGETMGHTQGDVISLTDNGKRIWVRLYRGHESTQWVQLTPGFGEALDLASQHQNWSLGV